MQRIYIKDIRDNLEKSILVQGFVENFRDGKAMCFIVLKDITGKVQITIEKEGHEELLPALGHQPKLGRKLRTIAKNGATKSTLSNLSSIPP